MVSLGATTPYLATCIAWRGAVASDYRQYRSLSAMRYCVLQSSASCLQHAGVCEGCTVLQAGWALSVYGRAIGLVGLGLVGLGLVAWPVFTSRGQADCVCWIAKARQLHVPPVFLLCLHCWCVCEHNRAPSGAVLLCTVWWCTCTVVHHQGFS